MEFYQWSTILILHWVDFYSVNKEKFSKTQLRTMNWNWVISNVLQMYCQYLFRDQNICINGMNKRYYLRESILYLHEDFANILSYSSFMVPYVILSDIEGWITTRIYAIIKSELTLNKSLLYIFVFNVYKYNYSLNVKCIQRWLTHLPQG